MVTFSGFTSQANAGITAWEAAVVGKSMTRRQAAAACCDSTRYRPVLLSQQSKQLERPLLGDESSSCNFCSTLWSLELGMKKQLLVTHFKPFCQLNKHCCMSLATGYTIGLYQLCRNKMKDFAKKTVCVSRKAYLRTCGVSIFALLVTPQHLLVIVKHSSSREKFEEELYRALLA